MICWPPAAPWRPPSALPEVGGDVPTAACIIELNFLDGRKRIDVPFSAVVSYDS